MWQAYSMFVFLWQFVIPLIIFVAAYWKIFGVVRRQAKVEADRRMVTMMAKVVKEPVAGPSCGTTAEVDGSHGGRQSESVEGSADVRLKDQRRGIEASQNQQNGGLSKAKLNVIRTMVYIIVCFVVCWMPKSLFAVYKNMTVTQNEFLPSVLRLVVLVNFVNEDILFAA